MLVGEMQGKRRALTPALQQTICEAIEAGNTRECAAGMAGVGTTWLYEQMARNVAFGAAIEKADADAEGHHVKNVQHAARTGEWTASAWWLERRRSQSWGRVVRQEVTGKDGAAIQHEVEHGGAIEVRAVDYRMTTATLHPLPLGVSVSSGEEEGAA
jgi:hypothetical protein